MGPGVMPGACWLMPAMRRASMEGRCSARFCGSFMGGLLRSGRGRRRGLRGWAAGRADSRRRRPSAGGGRWRRARDLVLVAALAEPAVGLLDVAPLLGDHLAGIREGSGSDLGRGSSADDGLGVRVERLVVVLALRVRVPEAAEFELLLGGDLADQGNRRSFFFYVVPVVLVMGSGFRTSTVSFRTTSAGFRTPGHMPSGPVSGPLGVASGPVSGLPRVG